VKSLYPKDFICTLLQVPRGVDLAVELRGQLCPYLTQVQENTMRTLTPILIAILLVACGDAPLEPGAEVLPQAATASNVLAVPGSYATIQAAVNAAQPGQLILVHGGTYEELVIVEKPSLTVRGVAGASVVGTFAIRADRVSVEGFHITTKFHSQGIQASFVRGASIRNNVIVSDGDVSDFRGVWLNDCQDCSVRNNRITDHRIDGIGVLGNLTGTDIRNNEIHNNGPRGIVAFPGSMGAAFRNNTVNGHSICDIVNQGTGHTFKNNRAGCTLGL
jgi:parallel beta-helix repeat protein